MGDKELKIPKEVIKDLDIHETDEIQNEFEISPVVEAHQVKLPVPRKLVNNFDLVFEKGKKITIIYDEKNNELRYKL